MKDIIAMDLFCGCGGFSLGLIQGGINVVLGLDFSYDALATYLYNLAADDYKYVDLMPDEKWRQKYMKNTHHFYGKKENLWPPQPRHDKRYGWMRTVKAVVHADITKIHGEDLLRYAGVDHVDLIAGSPPCQSFSSARAGGQLKYDPRDELSFEMARIINEIGPENYIMENVPYFAKKRLPDGRLIMDVFNQIAALGYWKKFDGCDLANNLYDLYYGIPKPTFEIRTPCRWTGDTVI